MMGTLILTKFANVIYVKYLEFYYLCLTCQNGYSDGRITCAVG